MRLFHNAWKMLVVVVVWVGLGWGVGYLRRIDAAWGTGLPGWARIPGAIVVMAGAVGVLWCGAMLSTRGIGTLGGDERFMPTEFLATGPFRFVRNPMSLAGVILMVGIALLHRSTLGLGLAAALFVLFHVVIVCVEEPGLEKRFGESYRAYKRGVPRWIPQWRAWSGDSLLGERHE